MNPAAIAGVAVYWVLNFCVDSCFPSPEFPNAHQRYETAIEWMEQDNANNPRHPKTWEEENKKTRCESARSDLLDKGERPNRWVWARCVEQPKNGHFHYLTE